MTMAKWRQDAPRRWPHIPWDVLDRIQIRETCPVCCGNGAVIESDKRGRTTFRCLHPNAMTVSQIITAAVEASQKENA